MSEPYWEVRDGDGPHLLLIHGFLSSRAQWLANLDALAAVCRPVVMELYGHGRSPVPAAGRCFETGAYAGAIDRIRECLGVAEWFVCGYSLGAAISIRYALDYAERVRGHVFTNSTSAFAEASLIDAWRANAAPAAARIRSGGSAAVDALAVHPRRARRLPDELREALMRDAALLDPEGVARAFEHTMPTASVRARLSHNARPALLVCGRRERRFAPHRQHAEAVMPNLSIVDVDSGHAVNMQAAPAFNAAVAEFVREHS